MKVLVVHNRYRSGAPSGENIVVDLEAATLRDFGHEVAAFERHSDEIETWPAYRRATVPAQVVWSERSRRDLVDAIRAFRPDVVHLHNTFPLISPAVLYACRSERVPAVVTLHNYMLGCSSGNFFRGQQPCHDCSGGSPLPALQHGCYRGSRLATVPLITGLVAHRRSWRTLASAYICISNAQRRLLAHVELPDERVFVKWNMVEPIERPVRVPKPQVAYVGRLDQVKGVGVLMAAWDDYLRRVGEPGLRLAIAGSGPMADEVQAWAATRPSVDALGLLTRQQCGELLSTSLAALITSQWEEPFGLVAIEAMAAATAPVATAHGAFPELITPGENGELFTPGDPAALAGLLVEIERDPQRFEALGEKARASYEAVFRPETNVSQLLDIYRYAIANPAASG